GNPAAAARQTIDGIAAEGPLLSLSPPVGRGPLPSLPPPLAGEGGVGAGSGEGRNEGGMANIHVLFLTNRTGKNIVMKAKRMPHCRVNDARIQETEFPVKLQKIPCSQGISAGALRRLWETPAHGPAERDCSSNGAVLQRFAAEFLLQIGLSAARSDG